ncbi:MAG: MotA/TolQ/ExbB proton channel family protein [Chthoniobacteraceae bacterium]
MKSLVLLLAVIGLGLSHLAAQNPPAGQPAGGARPPAAAPAADGSVTRLPGSDTAKAAKPGTAYIPPAPPVKAGTTMLKMIQDGGWAMVPLGVLSVLTVMLVLVFLATLRRSAILTTHYMNTADVLLKKRDYLGLLAISSRHGEAVARVVQRTLDFATKNPGANFDVVKSIAESEASAQAASFQHRVTYLADIGTLSPMVGLFGTVWGIIEAFGELAHGAGGNRDWALAGGVSQALIATGTGLIIGITAFVFYALFRNKVQRLISDLEVAGAHVVGLIALNYKKREPSRTAIDEEF